MSFYEKIDGGIYVTLRPENVCILSQEEVEAVRNIIFFFYKEKSVYNVLRQYAYCSKCKEYMHFRGERIVCLDVAVPIGSKKLLFKHTWLHDKHDLEKKVTEEVYKYILDIIKEYAP